MTDDDFQAFTELLAAEGELRGRPPLSEGALLLWWSRLKQHSLAEVRRALAQHGLDPERGRFMPQPADVVRQIVGSSEERAALAWAKTLEAITRLGGWTDVVFDDPAIHATVAALGGWPQLCEVRVDQLSYTQHRFAQTYVAFANARAGGEAGGYPAVLYGRRSDDHSYRVRGLEPPQPELIGDIDRCHAVIAGGRERGSALQYAAIRDALELRTGEGPAQ